jgi:hypothetical protein
MVTVVPETVHTPVVELVKVTVVPAESLSATVKVPAPPATQVSVEGEVKLNVWFVAPIVIFEAVPGVVA